MTRGRSHRRVAVVVGCLSLVIVCLAGCRRGAAPAQVDERLVSANTTFAFKLLHEVVGEKPRENVFLSPSSVAVALAMTYNGAAGETREAMAKALELAEISIEDVNQANADLKASLEQAEPAVELAIANSLWMREGIPFVEEFLATNEQFYKAKLSTLDFDDPSAVPTINAWVKEQTRGKIENIVQAPISEWTTLFLINAAYFKGRWAEEFESSETRAARFRLLDGKQKTVQMMSREGDYKYLSGEGFEAIQLPYVDDRLSMCIFLPRPESSLARFYERLTADNWAAWLKAFKKLHGYIAMPRLKLEYEHVLNDALTAMGMAVAFDWRRANFTNMRHTRGPVWIEEVRHKTFVQVNEEGTEAAAATKVEMGEGVEEQQFRMVVDRPFFCAIRDNQTGTVLFAGVVVNPGE